MSSPQQEYYRSEYHEFDVTDHRTTDNYTAFMEGKNHKCLHSFTNGLFWGGRERGEEFSSNRVSVSPCAKSYILHDLSLGFPLNF